VTYTHKGWLGLCPVYIAEPDSESPWLAPRLLWLGWWLDFNSWALYAAGTMLSSSQDEFEPHWPIRITGKLEVPVEIEP